MIRFLLLGSVDLRSSDGRELRHVLAQPKRTALLTYLAVATPRGFHRRDTLLAMFWPEFPATRARKALRQAVHFLRRELGDAVVVGRGDEELAVDPEQVWCDAVEFQRAVESDPAAALEQYRGDLLPGFFISDAPEFERWLEEERATLRRRAAAAAADLAARSEAGRGESSALHWARQAAALAPDDEPALRQLLESLVRSGDRAGAARVYRDFVDRLRRDFGVDPAAETQALFAALNVSVPASLEAVALPALPAADTPGQRPPASIVAPRRHTTYALGAVVALLLLVAGIIARRYTNGLAPRPDAVAVLPFPVRGSRELDYLREGMVDLLSAKLAGAPGLRSIDPRAVIAAIRGDTAAAVDPNGGRRIAERFGAGFYVAGDVVDLAGRLQLSASLYSQRNRWAPVTQVNVEGDAPELPTLVDQLVAQLLTALGQGRDTTLIRLAGLTTHSLPALRAYLEGASDFRAGRQAEAVEAFQEAVHDDTGFALAYYDLSVANRWVSSDGRLTAQAAAQAAQRVEHLPALARELLRGYAAYTRGNGDSAEALYRAITASHPDDIEGWYMLGETLFHFNGPRGRPFTEARSAFDHVLALDSTDVHALVHLARIAASEGDTAELELLAHRVLTQTPEAEPALEMRTLLAFALSDSAEQRRVDSAALRTTDTELQACLLDILAYDQKLDGTPGLALAYAEPSRSLIYQRTAHAFLAQVAPARGIWRHYVLEPPVVAAADRDWPLEARALFAVTPGLPLPRAWLVALRDSVERLQPHPAAQSVPPGDNFRYHFDLEPEARAYLIGLLSARLEDTLAARKSITELERLSRSPGDSGIGEQLAHGVRAEVVQLEQGAKAALSEVSQFRLDYQSPTHRIFWAGSHVRLLKAELLYDLGRDEEALPLFASFPREGWDLVSLAPSQLREAEIDEHLGRRREAIAHYSRFVDLWKDAEPELQGLVTQARQAQHRLLSEP